MTEPSSATPIVADRREFARFISTPWAYFLLAFAWSWLCWIPAAALGQPLSQPVPLMLFILGGLGPAVAAIVLLMANCSREERRDYWQRLFDWHRISPRWYAIIFVLAPGLALLAVLTGHYLAGHAAYAWQEPLRLLSHPAAMLGLFVFTFFVGPLPEELGWRGYALPLLQVKYDALRSSLILAFFWGLWHAPMFFIPGTYQQAQLTTWELRLLFFLGIIPSTVLITWIFNHTGQSTLAAVLFHCMDNLTGEFFHLPTRLAFWRTGWATVAAIAVVFSWQRMRRKSINRPR